MIQQGFNPFSLVYGHYPILPLDALLGQKIKYFGEHYIPQQLQSLNKAFIMARENLEDIGVNNKMKYDQKASDQKFTIGDAVYYKNDIIKKGHSTSLSLKWRSYYRVVAETGPVTSVIINQLTGKNW